MSYNLTGVASNSTNLVSFISGVNDVLLFGWFGVLILISITSVLFMAFMHSTNDVRKAISASSFIAFGLSIFLSALGWLPPLALFITLLGSAAALAFTWNNG